MIKTIFPVFLMLVMTTMAYGQHSDIEFGYERDSNGNAIGIEIEQDNVTSHGIQFFESEFEEDPGAGPEDFFTIAPGFATALNEGLSLNANDQLHVRILNASDSASVGADVEAGVGAGYVNFYDPSTGLITANHRVQVGGDATGSTSDLILNGSSLSSSDDNPQLLGVAEDDPDDLGDVHGHLVFDLLDDSDGDDATSPVGAYGLLLQLEADFADVNGNVDGNIDLVSGEFWIIFNRGLSETQFEEGALGAFGVTAVPEPASAVVIAGAFGALLVRRRRQS